jgi:hypothetical protein
VADDCVQSSLATRFLQREHCSPSLNLATSKPGSEAGRNAPRWERLLSRRPAARRIDTWRVLGSSPRSGALGVTQSKGSKRPEHQSRATARSGSLGQQICIRCSHLLRVCEKGSKGADARAWQAPPQSIQSMWHADGLQKPWRADGAAPAQLERMRRRCFSCWSAHTHRGWCAWRGCRRCRRIPENPTGQNPEDPLAQIPDHSPCKST